jgi:hypothetical protein
MMSPAQVPASRPNGVDVDTDPADSGAAAMRMSPKRGSPCNAPGVPSGEPSSGTTVRFALI